MMGASCWQCGHQTAKNSRTTRSPRCDASVYVLPFTPLRVKLGALVPAGRTFPLAVRSLGFVKAGPLLAAVDPPVDWITAYTMITTRTSAVIRPPTIWAADRDFLCG